MKYFALFVIIGGLIFIGSWWQEGENELRAEIQIGESRWLAGLAVTEAERSLGLGKRQELPPREGLLFVFPTMEQHQFWMKDMQFSLDLIFIAGNTVESVIHHVDKDDKRILTPQKPVNFVLEVNAGEADSIQPGDKVLGLPFKRETWE